VVTIAVELAAVIDTLRNAVEGMFRTGDGVADVGRTFMDWTLAVVNMAATSPRASSSPDVNFEVSPGEMELLREAAATALAALKVTPDLLQQVLLSGISGVA